MTRQQELFFNVPTVGEVAPEGVDFDGVNDYLSRSTDLVGNVDSKTFTFSAWVYVKNSIATTSYIYVVDDDYFYVSVSPSALNVKAKNSSATIILNAGVDLINFSAYENKWINILVSIDLSNTSKRFIYINDVLQTVTWTTYTNTNIDRTRPTHNIVSNMAGSGLYKCRCSNIFLDYTYRDLSIESNRRLFITADGKPTPTATLKALNPILYLPMKDSATAHINEGTGGNFTLNGTIATSNRGANQDNCVASYFDGTADYLSKVVSGLQDATKITIAVAFKDTTSNRYLFSGNRNQSVYGNYFTLSSSLRGFAFLYVDTSGNIKNSMSYYTSSTGNYLHFNQTHFCYLSLDTTTGKYCIGADGKAVTGSLSLSAVSSVALSTFIAMYIGATDSTLGTIKFLGNIGELYFDTKYIDLATSNPFWDAVENKPIPVRKVIADTGVTPLIAMPLDASNAGKNYGTGGDFTANSGPYVGARAASEFWARSAKFDGTTGYLSKGTMGTTTKTISAFFFANSVNLTSRGIVSAANGVYDRFSVYIGSTSGTLTIVAKNLTNSNVIIATTSITFSANTWFSCFISIDLTSTATRQIVINGVVDTGVTWSLYNTAENIYLADATEWRVGEHARTDVNYFLEGNIGSPYLTSQYIDFSQEVNRLKFIDGLGYPLDLAKQIEAGVIPNPIIYLPFNDPSNLGLNLGTGGNLAVNGTISQGSDVNG